MALGIDRDTIGDIISGENSATLICLPEMGGFIMENLAKAGRVGIRVSEICLDELPARQEELNIKTDTVASLRLDAVLSTAFGLSRSKAAELIAAGRVSLDHLPCVQHAKEGSICPLFAQSSCWLAVPNFSLYAAIDFRTISTASRRPRISSPTTVSLCSSSLYTL